jgi:iron complex transport system substrate-binding protein
MGETCVPNHPKRVIILSPYGLLSNAITLGVKPIASSVHSIEDLNANYSTEQAHLGEEIKGIQQIGLANSPNIEKISLLKPDLILAWEPAKKIYSLLSQIAPTVVVPRDMPDWKEPKWKDQFSFVAEVLGKQAVAKEVMNQYYQRLEELKVALGNRYQNQTISVASAVGNNNFIMIKNSFVGSILDELGLQRPPAQNVVAPNDATYNISEEKLEMLDGDILFFPVHDIGAREAYERLKHEPLWKKLKAVQKGQVYLVDFWAWIVWEDPSGANAVFDDLEKYLVNTP